MGLIISRYFSEHAGELPELQHLMLSNLADRADPHVTAGKRPMVQSTASSWERRRRVAEVFVNAPHQPGSRPISVAKVLMLGLAFGFLLFLMHRQACLVSPFNTWSSCGAKVEYGYVAADGSVAYGPYRGASGLHSWQVNLGTHTVHYGPVRSPPMTDSERYPQLFGSGRRARTSNTAATRMQGQPGGRNVKQDAATTGDKAKI